MRCNCSHIFLQASTPEFMYWNTSALVMTVHKRMGIERMLLPVCLVLLQKLIPVFSLLSSKQWRALVEGLGIDFQLVQIRTQRNLLRKRRNDMAAFQKLLVLPGLIKMSEKSFWHVTNKQASSQSCSIWGPLPRQGESWDKMSSRQNPSQGASSAIPCAALVCPVLEDRAANIYTLHGLLCQAAAALITSHC